MKKGYQIIIAITLSFLFLIAGVYIGRYTIRGTLSVESSKAVANQPTESDISDALGNRKININKATTEELVLLPGIGETLAQRIIAYRQIHGNFSSIDDILNVEGIGEGKFSQISKYITVDESE